MTPYKTAASKAAQLAEITKNSFRRGQFERARRCLKVGEELLKTGSAEMRHAVCNTYLYSVSLFLDLHHFNTSALLPERLLGEYRLQLNTTGT